jgi:hypothetical protein
VRKLILVCLLFSGCAGAPLTKEQESVRILRKSDPPKECKDLGSVYLTGYETITMEMRDNNMKRSAHDKGGNTIQIEEKGVGEPTYGYVFNCPN